jgi:DNA-binding CsgD family transcriptional regulator
MDREAQTVRVLEGSLMSLWPRAPAAPALGPRVMQLSDHPSRPRDGVALAQLQLLDQINLAAAVVSREERIVGLNRRCERVLGCGLTRQCDRLIARDRASHERLRKAIRAVFSGQGRLQGEAGCGVIHREPEMPILFKALPLDLSPIDGMARHALLIFSSPHLQSLPDPELLARAFGLTPAQGRVACHLARGRSLEAAAARLGVKKETVRNHLKQIFLRTGTCRQGELVALLSPFWLAARDEGEKAAG